MILGPGVFTDNVNIWRNQVQTATFSAQSIYSFYYVCALQLSGLHLNFYDRKAIAIQISGMKTGFLNNMQTTDRVIEQAFFYYHFLIHVNYCPFAYLRVPLKHCRLVHCARSFSLSVIRIPNVDSLNEACSQYRWTLEPITVALPVNPDTLNRQSRLLLNKIEDQNYIIYIITNIIYLRQGFKRT